MASNHTGDYRCSFTLPSNPTVFVWLTLSTSITKRSLIFPRVTFNNKTQCKQCHLKWLASLIIQIVNIMIDISQYTPNINHDFHPTEYNQIQVISGLVLLHNWGERRKKEIRDTDKGQLYLLSLFCAWCQCVRQGYADILVSLLVTMQSTRNETKHLSSAFLRSDICKRMCRVKKETPRRGIEPRFPAWQAGILTTILPRTLFHRLESSAIALHSLLLSLNSMISSHRTNGCKIDGNSRQHHLLAWPQVAAVDRLEERKSEIAFRFTTVHLVYKRMKINWRTCVCK